MQNHVSRHRHALLWIGVLALIVFSFAFVQRRTGDGTAQAEASRDVLRYPMLASLRTLHLSPPLNRRSRPTVAVMIENHQEARPEHQGLEGALLIEEFLVESGITRFAVLFDAEDLPERIGPVRSLRPYFVDALRPWTSLVLHAGGSPEAFERVEETDDLTAVNALRYEFDQSFVRDKNISAPHNLFTTAERLQPLLDGRSLTHVRWPPYQLGPPQGTSGANLLHLNFLSRVHNVAYVYNHGERYYERENGGVKSKAHPRNVLILQMPVTDVGEYGRLTIPVDGDGPLLLFRDGLVVRGTWKKDTAGSEFFFENEQGDLLAFTSGLTWMTVMTDLERVTWE